MAVYRLSDALNTGRQIHAERQESHDKRVYKKLELPATRLHVVPRPSNIPTDSWQTWPCSDSPTLKHGQTPLCHGSVASALRHYITDEFSTAWSPHTLSRRRGSTSPSLITSNHRPFFTLSHTSVTPTLWSEHRHPSFCQSFHTIISIEVPKDWNVHFEFCPLEYFTAH